MSSVVTARPCRVVFGILLAFVLYESVYIYFHPTDNHLKQLVDYSGTDRIISDIVRGNDVRPSVISESVEKHSQPQSEVLRWDGKTWVQWKHFCADKDIDNYVLVDLHSPAGNIDFYVHDYNHDSYTSRIIVKTHTYEPTDLKLMYQHLLEDNNMGLVDIGSHVGLYSVIAAQMGRQVITVDPLHMNVHAWCHSIVKNHFMDRVKQIYTIMSSEHRLMTFTTHGIHVGGTTVHVAEDQETPVSTFDRNYTYSATLNDLLPLMTFKKAFLKIDVETHEFEVMAGAERFLANIDVPYILMEWIHHQKSDSRQKIIDFMTKYGYKGYTTDRETEVDFKRQGFLNNILWKK